MKVGDNVRFCANWLRRTGNLVGEVPYHTGTIVELDPVPLRPGGPCFVTVEWTGGRRSGALTSNLEVTEGPTW